MTIVMNMSDYEIEREALEIGYDDEILWAGWNPEVDTVCQQLQPVPTTEKMAMPTSLTTEVVGLFLRKMYSYHH